MPLILLQTKEGESSDMKDKAKKKKSDAKPDGNSVSSIESMPDLYEDFRPEEINEIFFTEAVQRDRSVHHENLWFFTRC